MLKRWTSLLRRLGLVLGLYVLLRAIFLVCNDNTFSQANARQIGLAFLSGLRFDLSAIAAINFPFILLSFLPRQSEPSPGYARLLKGVFLGLNIPFLLINVVDLEYFKFTGRRSTLDLLGVAGDAGVKWPALVGYYWPLALIGLGLSAALYLLYGRAPKRPALTPGRLNVWVWLLNLAAVGPLCLVAFRGGLQMRTLNPAQAMPEAPGELAQLALNSSFTVLKSYHKKHLARYGGFRGRDELLAYLRPLVDGPKILADEPRHDNVVILILESFSAEYCGAGNRGSRYTPFLDSLASQSLFFTHNYANGRRSIEAMPSILAGLPSLMSESLLESIYQNNHLLGLGALLAPHGYTTSFFHGGQNGTMRFDTFARRAGIQNYFGLNEYPNKKDFDGHWGIFDEPYLQYVAHALTAQKPPFAAAIFTLSSHHPYPIPEKYRGRFKKGTLAIHESIGYTDFALEQFFATARQQPWYSNTLFIITGDHTQKLETPEYQNLLGQYRVPLLFHHPQLKFSGVATDRVTQHADILPSVLDYLQIQTDRRLLFGKSVFRQGEGRAFLHSNGHYWLVRGHDALELAAGGATRFFDLAQDPQMRSAIPGEPQRRRALEKEAQALLQYFNNGMLDNNLYDRAILSTIPGAFSKLR
jgi:arylsulfatase A-like enzyme